VAVRAALVKHKTTKSKMASGRISILAVRAWSDILGILSHSLETQYGNSSRLVGCNAESGTKRALTSDTKFAEKWAPRHGYGISQAIRAGSGEALCQLIFTFPALKNILAAESHGWID
jgi:hypothetical protein